MQIELDVLFLGCVISYFVSLSCIQLLLGRSERCSVTLIWTISLAATETTGTCVLLVLGIYQYLKFRILLGGILFGCLLILTIRKSVKTQIQYVLLLVPVLLLYGTLVQGSGILLPNSFLSIETSVFLRQLFCGLILLLSLKKIRKSALIKCLETGVLVSQGGTLFFYRGYCDSGNFLHGHKNKRVYVLDKTKFDSLFRNMEVGEIPVGYVDADNKKGIFVTKYVDRLSVTTKEGIVYQENHALVARGGDFTGRRFDILLPNEIMWKL